MSSMSNGVLIIITLITSLGEVASSWFSNRPDGNLYEEVSYLRDEVRSLREEREDLHRAYMKLKDASEYCAEELTKSRKMVKELEELINRMEEADDSDYELVDDSEEE